MKKLLSALTLLLIITTQATAQSSVWKVTKDNSVIYIGGSCHLLRKSDLPLPEEFSKAYNASEMLVTEVDVAEIKSPSTIMKLISKATYKDGSTVDKHLSPKVYSMLSEYCASNSIPLRSIKSLKPALISVFITASALEKLGASEEGADILLHKKAVKDRKTRGALETVDQQIDYILNMGEGNEDAFITHSLDETETISEDFDELVSAWKKGDIAKISEMLIQDVKKDTPEIYKNLIVERNKNWIPLIEEHLKSPSTEFILVGVAHVVGPDGLLEILKKKGCTIEQL